MRHVKAVTRPTPMPAQSILCRVKAIFVDLGTDNQIDYLIKMNDKGC